MPRRYRTSVLLLACLLAALVLLSALFLAAESDHDCVGEDCPICALLSLCRTLLRTTLPAAAVPATAIRAVGAAPLPPRSRPHPRATLVALRVKLSD